MQKLAAMSVPILCGPILCFAQIATNRTSSMPATLSEIVVTATREARELQSVPASTHRLDVAQKAQDEGVRTTPDLLEGIPSVLVQKTGYGQGSPYLRGFTGFRNLFLIDGIRLNNSVFRDGPNQYWNTVDPLSIDRCELVMGPASVLYGSDAIGGTLNVSPVAPPEYDGKPVWQRRLYYRGATAEGSHVGRVQVGGQPTEEFGFVGGVSLKSYGDLRGGRNVGKQEHTGYDELDFDLRADYHFDGDTFLTIGHQSVDQDDAWRTHRTIYGLDWEGLSKGDDKVHRYDQTRDLTYLRFGAERLDGVVDGVVCTISRQVQSEDLYRLKKDDKSETQGFDVTTWGADLQVASDSPVGRWVYGAEYYRDGVASYARKHKKDGTIEKEEIQGPVADEAAYDSLGLYVQDTFAFLDGAADLIPGIRYTHTAADADAVKDPLTGKRTSVSGDWDGVVGSLRVLFPLTQDRRHVVFAGAAQGYRAPNLSDLTRFDIARSGELETPSPDLESEKYVTYEIGLKSRFETLTAEVCGYRTTIDGMIVRAPTGRQVDGLVEVTRRNAGDGFVEGVELTSRYAFSENWSVWLSGSLQNGKVKSYPTSSATRQEEYITRLMPPTAQAGLRWQTDDAKCWCEVLGDAAAKADKLSEADRRDTQRIPPGGTPGYVVYQARTGAQVTKRLALAVAVENIFDEDYRIHGSGVNEPGRNLMFTASCEF
jgi:hemoglobin/transferrin/lactoferrin receptor protein